MKRIIATAILGCFLLGADAAVAGPVTKFVFENITAIPEAGPLTIRAGTKEVKTGMTPLRRVLLRWSA